MKSRRQISFTPVGGGDEVVYSPSNPPKGIISLNLLKDISGGPNGTPVSLMGCFSEEDLQKISPGDLIGIVSSKMFLSYLLVTAGGENSLVYSGMVIGETLFSGGLPLGSQVKLLHSEIRW